LRITSSVRRLHRIVTEDQVTAGPLSACVILHPPNWGAWPAFIERSHLTAESPLESVRSSASRPLAFGRRAPERRSSCAASSRSLIRSRFASSAALPWSWGLTGRGSRTSRTRCSGPRGRSRRRSCARRSPTTSSSQAPPGRPAADWCEVELSVRQRGRQFPELEFSEISITRRLHRGGEGQYLVNKAAVRRTDLVELLADVGLGGGHSSVIGQGRVEEILSSKPEHRRALLEEAAGLGKFKARRHRAELKLGARAGPGRAGSGSGGGGAKAAAAARAASDRGRARREAEGRDRAVEARLASSSWRSSARRPPRSRSAARPPPWPQGREREARGVARRAQPGRGGPRRRGRSARGGDAALYRLRSAADRLELRREAADALVERLRAEPLRLPTVDDEQLRTTARTAWPRFERALAEREGSPPAARRSPAGGRVPPLPPSPPMSRQRSSIRSVSPPPPPHHPYTVSSRSATLVRCQIVAPAPCRPAAPARSYAAPGRRFARPGARAPLFSRAPSAAAWLPRPPSPPAALAHPLPRRPAARASPAALFSDNKSPFPGFSSSSRFRSSCVAGLSNEGRVRRDALYFGPSAKTAYGAFGSFYGEITVERCLRSRRWVFAALRTSASTLERRAWKARWGMEVKTAISFFFSQTGKIREFVSIH
jgi:hypothetical protein